MVKAALAGSVGSDAMWGISARPTESTYVSGRILHVGEDYIAVQCYDDGAQLDALSLIEHRWIYRLQKGTPYAARLSREAGPPSHKALTFPYPPLLAQALEHLSQTRDIVSFLFDTDDWLVGQVDRVQDEFVAATALTDSGEVTGSEFFLRERLVRTDLFGPDEENVARLMASKLPRLE